MLKMVILDSIGKHNGVKNLSEALERALRKNQMDCTCVDLTQLNLLPCYGCDGCLKQTPGKCVMKDDTAQFMTPLARANAIIGITDVRYGGYSADYKLVADKFALMASPFYEMKDGKLLHRKRYSDYNAYYVVGLGTGLSEDETENFRLLVKRNAMNMSVDHWACFFTDGQDPEYLAQRVMEKVIDDERS